MICKAIDAIVAKNDVVEESDADQFSGLPEPRGESTILGAWRWIAGRVIVGGDDSAGIEKDGRFKNLAGMNDAEGERADRDDVDADDGVLGIETADKELLAVFAIALTTAGDAQINAVGTKLIAIAEAKTNYYASHGSAGLLAVFTKGMLCNWMVSLAVVAAFMSTSFSGKILAIWGPTLLFFSQGFEHGRPWISGCFCIAML